MSPLWTGFGSPQASRAKALRYAAAWFERRRRTETLAGPDVPLTGAAGWRLRQTLADKDARTWQVIAPDGTAAGTVRPSYAGARSWTASHGDPGRFQATVSPCDDERHLAGGDGTDWKTRNAAACAVARYHDPDGNPPAAEAAARAASLRTAAQET
jgi:hypothetical protein